MKINRLLELHQQHKNQNTLNDCFGDAYLYRHNRICKLIRDETLKQNYTFTSEENKNYLALPLAELDCILKFKKIPYFDNVSVLKKIEDKSPNLANWDDIRDNLRRNFIFHESAHVCARAVLNCKKDACKDLILNMLIEESFANTCELLAVHYVEDAAHRVFYELNSYATLFDQKNLIKSMVGELGLAQVITFVVYGYIHSNFLHNSIDDKSFNRVCDIVLKNAGQALNAKQVKMLRSLLRNCFTLDENFKQVTTRFYMKLSGAPLEHSKLITVDYLAQFERNDAYRGIVADLVTSIV